MQFVMGERESSLDEYLVESNKERENWVENLAFEIYGRKDIPKKINRKLFKKIMTIVYAQAEISTSIVFLNILLSHYSCSKEEILGASQLILLDKIKEGNKMDLKLPTQLDDLIKVCQKTIEFNTG